MENVINCSPHTAVSELCCLLYRKCPSEVEMSCFIFNFFPVVLFYGTIENNTEIITKNQDLIFFHASLKSIKEEKTIFSSDSGHNELSRIHTFVNVTRSGSIPTETLSGDFLDEIC